MADTSAIVEFEVDGTEAFGEVVQTSCLGTSIFMTLDNYTPKAWWEIEEEIEQYRNRMLTIHPRYEICGILHKQHTGDDIRKYYHLYKHRSY